MAYNQTTKVYSEIREKILKGEFKPSQPLIEMELATEFNVSRVTIKKALLMLKSESLVEMPENRSARVRSFDIDEIVQFLDTRIVLEGFCARLTAPVISDEAINSMENYLDEMARLYKSGKLMEYSETNKLFHKCVYDSCPNKVAVNMIWEIRNQISRFNFKTILVQGRVDASFLEHKAILEAYREHDADKAYITTINHVTNLKNTLLKNYQLLF